MDPFSAVAVRAAYDAVADDYVVAFADDLANLPLDREVLDAAWGAAAVGDDGWVLELGCGPAPAAAYLAGRGGRFVGVDLSAAMLGAAARRNPDLRVAQGDLRTIPLRRGACRLVVAPCSILGRRVAPAPRQASRTHRWRRRRQ